MSTTDKAYWRDLLRRGRCPKCSSKPKPCRRCKEVGSLPDPDATAAVTGWTFDNPASAVPGTVFVSFSDDFVCEDGSTISGADIDSFRSEQAFGTANITATDKFLAVEQIALAVSRLPRRYPRRAFLVSWAEGGFVESARREHDLTLDAAWWTIRRFFEKHPKLTNPWTHVERQPDPELCNDPACKTKLAHSPHGAATVRSFAGIVATPPRQIPDKAADLKWKKLNAKPAANNNARGKKSKRAA